MACRCIMVLFRNVILHDDIMSGRMTKCWLHKPLNAGTTIFLMSVGEIRREIFVRANRRNKKEKGGILECPTNSIKNGQMAPPKREQDATNVGDSDCNFLVIFKNRTICGKTAKIFFSS